VTLFISRNKLGIFKIIEIRILSKTDSVLVLFRFISISFVLIVFKLFSFMLVDKFYFVFC